MEFIYALTVISVLVGMWYVWFYTKKQSAVKEVKPTYPLTSHSKDDDDSKKVYDFLDELQEAYVEAVNWAFDNVKSGRDLLDSLYENPARKYRNEKEKWMYYNVYYPSKYEHYRPRGFPKPETTITLVDSMFEVNVEEAYEYMARLVDTVDGMKEEKRLESLSKKYGVPLNIPDQVEWDDYDARWSKIGEHVDSAGISARKMKQASKITKDSVPAPRPPIERSYL